MKKLQLLAAFLLMLTLSLTANAQSAPADYFPGKWKVNLEGTPGGDKVMVIALDRKDGKLQGYTLDEKTGKEAFKFSKVEEKGNTVTVYFPAGAMEVYMQLDKKDPDHLTGNMLDMFDAKGERVK